MSLLRKKHKTVHVTQSTLELANFISTSAASSINAHEDELKKQFDVDNVKGSNMLIAIYLEYLSLYAHLVNRTAFNNLGDAGRNKL
ncbi:MAG: hypothetical protein NTX11_03515 [Candidatus Saccharibacteria bacterium]|nr:hypothetical protein [Candidatus Saccharibacteria bacterium]